MFSAERQPIFDIPTTPEEEMTEIEQRQQIKQTWWNHYPSMTSQEDITSAIEQGTAEIVPDRGIGFRLSANIPQEFRVLNQKASLLLEKIGADWLEKIQSKGLINEGEEVFLVISSLARTIQHQQELIAKGYPAVKNSTHVKLGAFDIATKWFAENKPELLSELEEVLSEYSTTKTANVIKEPTIGALHIAVNPELVNIDE